MVTIYILSIVQKYMKKKKKRLYQKLYENNVGSKHSVKNLIPIVIYIGVKMKLMYLISTLDTINRNQKVGHWRFQI